MSTGFTKERAYPHDEIALPTVVGELNRLGYEAWLLQPDGHRPDARLASGEYLEVKTTGDRNLAIEINDVIEWRHIEASEKNRVYVISVSGNPPATDPQKWRVNTLESLVLMRGPLRPTGNGSNDDWYQYRPDTGVFFVDMFPKAPTLWSAS